MRIRRTLSVVSTAALLVVAAQVGLGSDPAQAVINGSFVFTTQADFQAGDPGTGTDVTTSPGDVVLAGESADEQSTDQSATTVIFGSAFDQWLAQTFTPSANGQLTKLDIPLACSLCGGSSQPDIIVSIQGTTGGVPDGTDLATVTIPGFNNSSVEVYTATFDASPNLTAGTQYAFVLRDATAPAPATTAYGIRIGHTGTYTGGAGVRTFDSGTTWAIDPIQASLNFHAYISTARTPNATYTSAVKDAGGAGTEWGQISWNANTSSTHHLKFQVAASNDPTGPFTFVGPGGSTGMYYTDSGGSLSQFNGMRYIKYAVILSSDNFGTPAVHDVTIDYVLKNLPSVPTITNLPGGATEGSSFTATVSTTGDGALSVTSSTPAICTVHAANPLRVIFVSFGSCKVTAHVAEGTEYVAASGTEQTFAVGLDVTTGGGTTPTPTPTATPTPTPTPTSTGTPSPVGPDVAIKLASKHKKTAADWYRSPVHVSFTCTPGSAPLATPCPDPVTLSKNKAGQVVTVTVTGADGGSTTASTGLIDIDRVKPAVHVTGKKSGLTCHATDGLSGIKSCVITRVRHKDHGVTKVHWTATATDKSGNKKSIDGHYRVAG